MIGKIHKTSVVQITDSYENKDVESFSGTKVRKSDFKSLAMIDSPLGKSRVDKLVK
jgi:hypothetical protein